jgi:hypothetical protein
MFMPWLYHNQGLLLSITAMLCQLAVLSLFCAFAKMNITFDEGLKWLKALCVITIICYIISLVFYPRMVLGEERESVDLSRGIPRLFMPFIQFVVLIFLFYLEQWLNYHNNKAKIWTILTALFIVLSVTRQVILFSFFCAFVMCMHYLSTAKRILLIFFLGGCVLLITQLPFVQTMIELSEDQAAKNEDQQDIRIVDYIYFCQVAQANDVTRILGNGSPHASSAWSKEHDWITESLNIYEVDVGWASFYWRYGLITIIGLLSLFGRIAIRAYKEHDRCFAYWILYIVLTSFTSGPILYLKSFIPIIFTCSLLIIKYSKK